MPYPAGTGSGIALASEKSVVLLRGMPECMAGGVES